MKVAKKAKNDHFIKNISFPTVFKQIYSNFHNFSQFKFKSFQCRIFFWENVLFIQKRELFFLNFGPKSFKFHFIENSNNQKLLKYLRNISWKFEIPSLKILGGNRFLVIFLNYQENWLWKNELPSIL